MGRKNNMHKLYSQSKCMHNTSIKKNNMCNTQVNQPSFLVYQSNYTTKYITILITLTLDWKLSTCYNIK